jgi:hypothetical protein
MTRPLLLAVLVAHLVLPSFALSASSSPSNKPGSSGPARHKSTAQAGGKQEPPKPVQPGNAGGANSGAGSKTDDAKKPLPFVVPRAKIIQITGTASQILAVATTQARVQGTSKDSEGAKKFFEDLNARAFYSEPALRPGEQVCLSINPPGIVAAQQDFDRTHPCRLTLFTFEGFDGNRDVVRLTETGQLAYEVPEGALRDRLKEIGVGSTVVLAGATNGDHSTLSQIEVPRIEVDATARFWAMAVTTVAFFIFASLALGRAPFGIFLGTDNRYSSSKFQAALWFGALITTYLVTLFFRWTQAGLVGGVSIPTNLLLMSGLSMLTFAGAKAIKQNQVGNAESDAQKASQEAQLAMTAANVSADVAQKAQDAAMPHAPQASMTAVTQHAAAVVAQNVAQGKQTVLDTLQTAGTPRFWRDLTHDDKGTPSLSKFQLMVVILVAVGIYWFQAWEFLSTVPIQAKIALPDVDSALLTAFGLGQGAYLGVKFASDG